MSSSILIEESENVDTNDRIFQRLRISELIDSYSTQKRFTCARARMIEVHLDYSVWAPVLQHFIHDFVPGSDVYMITDSETNSRCIKVIPGQIMEL